MKLSEPRLTVRLPNCRIIADDSPRSFRFCVSAVSLLDHPPARNSGRDISSRSLNTLINWPLLPLAIGASAFNRRPPLPSPFDPLSWNAIKAENVTSEPKYNWGFNAEQIRQMGIRLFNAAMRRERPANAEIWQRERNGSNSHKSQNR